jgi:OmpA-OmpF porin, OOP family
MRRPDAGLAVAAVIMVLAGCSSDIEQLRNAQPTAGTEFTRALADEYSQMAAFEADRMHDWPDAAYFSRKGLAAEQGEIVLPEDPANWDIPAGMVDELIAACARLMDVLDDGAREHQPALAARAQNRFDCWVENAEENHQQDHISACRNEFEWALELATPLPGEWEPVDTTTDQGGLPPVYIFLFDVNSAQIRPDGEMVLKQLLADVDVMGSHASNNGVARLYITGRADRSGPPGYNRALAFRRADEVRRALTSSGVSADQIAVTSCGEEAPFVRTADGMPDQSNRSVEVTLQCDIERAEALPGMYWCPRTMSLPEDPCSGE